jgi:ABC-type Fe3+/spermidine/putrescine transport system ATPase subunit
MAVSDRIAVMSEGTIVQEGSAEDLYHRPASEFVARFIGRVNLVAGQVIALEGAMARVEALGAQLQAVARGARPGDAVRLVLRPEAIGLAPAGDGIAASVLARSFLGDKIEYLVRCGSETLHVTQHNTGAGASFAGGEAVALRFPEGEVALLPSGSAA